MTTAPVPPTTTHLTRIKIDPWSHEAGLDLRNAQSLHRRILGLIPDQLGDQTRQAAGVLYRLERLRHSHTVLIQSQNPLNLDALPVGYASATDERDLTPLLNWCQTGAVIRYRLDAVPTRSTATQERNETGRRKRGRITALFDEDAISWWQRKAEPAGLTTDPTTIQATRQDDIIGWKEDLKKPGTKYRFGKSVTRFEGTATISAPHALRTAITTGIGRSKAYGAGLLSIAPLNHG